MPPWTERDEDTAAEPFWTWLVTGVFVSPTAREAPSYDLRSSIELENTGSGPVVTGDI